jgi:adenylate cyclase
VDPVSAGSAHEAIELAFWESIDGSDDPHLFAAYLEKYPEGAFAVIARARLEVLGDAGASR